MTQVLAVDDDNDCLVMLQHMLRLRGFSVTVASSGQEALGILPSVQPDLILLDVMMPGMTGLSVLETLKESYATQAIPVIIVSARGLDEDLMNGYVAGADYYITKPFTSSQLMYGIESVLGAAMPPMMGDARADDSEHAAGSH